MWVTMNKAEAIVTSVEANGGLVVFSEFTVDLLLRNQQAVDDAALQYWNENYNEVREWLLENRPQNYRPMPVFAPPPEYWPKGWNN